MFLLHLLPRYDLGHGWYDLRTGFLSRTDVITLRFVYLLRQMRRMTILLQWTYYILLHRTRMLLAELMFAMYGNANYEPDGDIILESTQIIPQTDEDCLDLVFDEPSWIAQKHRKIGII
ncbi:hypothetical protein AVEN_93377-1 [Araneus ventricosus]|uniref:Uncharacterized protein n=2 Tax=Araneus ventricosus TaxID=182803 RepID=A0A4Y2AQU9_ARAVE|nr:hypothetical protein AVEN_93377-1 [Araneus ventricosus]